MSPNLQTKNSKHRKKETTLNALNKFLIANKELINRIKVIMKKRNVFMFHDQLLVSDYIFCFNALLINIEHDDRYSTDRPEREDKTAGTTMTGVPLTTG